MPLQEDEDVAFFKRVTGQQEEEDEDVSFFKRVTGQQSQEEEDDVAFFNRVTAQPVKKAAATPTPVKPAPVVAAPAKPKPIERTPLPAGLDYGADVDLMGLGGAPETVGEDRTAIPRTNITVEEVAKDPTQLNVISTYMTNRMGDDGKRKPQETEKEYVQRFRKLMTKGEVGVLTELNWISNQKTDVKQQAGQAYAIAEKVGTRFTDEMLTALNPAESPSTYYTMGAGFFIRKAAERSAKTFLYRKAIGTSAGAGIQGGVAALSDLARQDTRIAAEMQEERDYTQTAVAVGLNAVLGGVEGFGMVDIKNKGMMAPEKTAKYLKEQAEKKNIPLTARELTPDEDKFIKQFSEKLSKEKQPLFEDVFERQRAREPSLDKISPPTELTSAVLSNDTVKNVFALSKQLLIELPELRDMFDIKTERATSIVSRIIAEVPNLNEDIIDRALTKSGISREQFADSLRVSMSEFGAGLGEASRFSKFVKKLGDVDPEINKMINSVVRNGNDLGAELMAPVFRGIQRAGKETRALAVSGFSTAVNNAAGGVGYLTLKTGGDIFTDVLMAVPKMTSDMLGGFRGKGVDPADLLGDTLNLTARMSLAMKAGKKSLGETAASLRSDVDVYSRIVNSGMTAELADKMLKNNPRLNRIISNVGVDIDRSDISKFSQLANTFNMAVDSAIRRPIFVASVYRQLKDLGLDADAFMIQNKSIPVEILNKAADETLAATFSMTPKKPTLKPESWGARSVGSWMGNLFVTAAERIPVVGDLFAPFARFTAGAIAYQYKSTPFNAIGAGNTFYKALKETDPAKKAAMLTDAKENFGMAAAGAGAIAAGYAYRDANRDIKPTEMRRSDGTVVDISTKFPFVNFMVMGELVRWFGDALYQPVKEDLILSPKDRQKKIEEYKSKSQSLVYTSGERAEFRDKADLLESESVRKLDVPEMMQVFTGYGRTGGTPIVIFENIAKAWEDSDSRSVKKLEDTVAETLGQWVGRVKGPFKPFIDLANSVKEEQTVLRDTKTGEEGFLPQVARSAVAGIEPAEEALGMQPRRDPLQEPVMKRGGDFVKQLTGAMPGKVRTKMETELMRHDIKVYALYKPTGIRELDNFTKEVGARDLINGITKVIQLPRYINASKGDQKKLLKASIQDVTKRTRDAAYLEFSKDPANFEKIIDMQWSGLPQEDRQALIARANKEGVGKDTPMEKAYLMDSYTLELKNVEKEGALINR